MKYKLAIMQIIPPLFTITLVFLDCLYPLFFTLLITVSGCSWPITTLTWCQALAHSQPSFLERKLMNLFYFLSPDKNGVDGWWRLGTISVFIQPFICVCSIPYVQSKDLPCTAQWLSPHRKSPPNRTDGGEGDLCLQQALWCQCLCVRMENHQNRQLTGEKIANKIQDCSHFLAKVEGGIFN